MRHQKNDSAKPISIKCGIDFFDVSSYNGSAIRNVPRANVIERGKSGCSNVDEKNISAKNLIVENICTNMQLLMP